MFFNSKINGFARRFIVSLTILGYGYVQLMTSHEYGIYTKFVYIKL